MIIFPMQKLFEFYIMLGKEGHWIWPYSGEDLTVSYWGPNHPNTNSSNADDCGVMVVQPDNFWWQDSTCLTTQIQQNKVAPICQRTEVVCADGVEFEGHCYMLILTPSLNWQDAEQDCISRGGHLTSINSKAEGDFILELSGDSIVNIWLGGSDLSNEVIM